MENLSIVLVGTSHPGNIGAAARAMKVMGLTRLQLVAPLHFPHEEATSRASGAADLLESASVHTTLDDALAGTEYVLGASARQRTIAWPSLPPRAAAEKLVREFRERPVAVVFGRERTGLENAELERCHGLVTIPAAPGYSSLNLAAAVQVIAYELRLAALGDLAAEVDPGRDGPPATADEMEQLYGHLERVMLGTGFLDPDNPKHLMRRLRRLFHRAQPDQNELNILRGLLASVERPTGKKFKKP
jgi:tRNA/rRNA methyltransferase/tRNA (cytidine32/uridine32-2'-O)-methyltransferase